MPNKSRRRRRKFRRYIRGRCNEEISIVGLTTFDLVSAAFDQTTEEEAFISSIEATWTLENFTPGEGTIHVGIAHSDYTAAEIEEWLEATDSWNTGDKVQQEKARRKCRLVGSFAGLLADERLNDGKPLKTMLKFAVLSSQGLSVWAYNKTSSTFTSGNINVEGHVNIWPR